MKKLFTENEYNNANAETKLKLQCKICDNVFFKKKREINKVIRGFRTGEYCSKKCHYQDKTTRKEVDCTQCNKKFTKDINQIMRTKNNFCSRSCAARYNNTHKIKGTRISKLEVWLSEQLTILYPNLEIHYNKKDAINSELDIYIPSLKLAFELNGIFHYEPIYGPDKLKQIQNNDDRKFQACIENNIELVIIDSSSMSYWKPEKGKKYLDIITNIIILKYASIV